VGSTPIALLRAKRVLPKSSSELLPLDGGDPGSGIDNRLSLHLEAEPVDGDADKAVGIPMAVGKDVAGFDGGAGVGDVFALSAEGSCCCCCCKKARNRVASCGCCCGDIESSPGWLKRWKDWSEGMMKEDVSEEKSIDEDKWFRG